MTRVWEHFYGQLFLLANATKPNLSIVAFRVQSGSKSVIQYFYFNAPFFYNFRNVNWEQHLKHSNLWKQYTMSNFIMKINVSNSPPSIYLYEQYIMSFSLYLDWLKILTFLPQKWNLKDIDHRNIFNTIFHILINYFIISHVNIVSLTF